MYKLHPAIIEYYKNDGIALEKRLILLEDEYEYLIKQHYRDKRVERINNEYDKHTKLYEDMKEPQMFATENQWLEFEKEHIKIMKRLTNAAKKAQVFDYKVAGNTRAKLKEQFDIIWSNSISYWKFPETADLINIIEKYA